MKSTDSSNVLVFLAAGLLCGVSAAFVSGSASAMQTADRRVIEVVARRYAFEPSSIEVAQDEPIRLMVRSADGPHGFEIKPLKISRELARGAAPVAIDFVASQPGEFPILCSLYCGEGHEEMKGVLVVKARAQAP
jgi:cytochrome c oxidase subunit 2